MRRAAVGSIGPIRPPRPPGDYLRLAQTILASEAWRNTRAGPPAERRRTLGLLLERALDEVAAE